MNQKRTLMFHKNLLIGARSQVVQRISRSSKRGRTSLYSEVRDMFTHSAGLVVRTS